jgi:uncharacterized membrane protein
MMIAKIRYVKICVAVLVWMVVLLAATHQSHPAAVLGRYSWNYASLLGLLVGVAVTLSLDKSAREQGSSSAVCPCSCRSVRSSWAFA